MSTGDVRIAAWITAWNRLIAADKFRDDYRKQVPDPDKPLPSDYWALLASAQAFATLSLASTATGFIAADELDRRERAEEAQRQHIADMLDKSNSRIMKDRNDDDFTEVDHPDGGS